METDDINRLSNRIARSRERSIGHYRARYSSNMNRTGYERIYPDKDCVVLYVMRMFQCNDDIRFCR
jgi:hypothetical protein